MFVDEMQTGVGVTGKMWAHEHWGLTTPPDMVTFSKKAQAAGFYYGRQNLRPDKGYRQFNTWMGDPIRALLFRVIYQEIEKRDLVISTARVKGYIYKYLESLAERFPQHFQNLRGKGCGRSLLGIAPERTISLPWRRPRASSWVVAARPPSDYGPC